MAFKSPSQISNIAGPKGLELKKKSLQKEIEILGIQHEKTTNTLKEIELRKSKIKDNKALLERLGKKKDKLELIFDKLEIEIKEQEKKLSEFKEQYSQKNAALNLEFSEKKNDLENELLEVKNDIKISLKKLDDFNIEKDKLEEEKNGLGKDIEKLKGEIKMFKSDYIKLEKIIKDLPEKERREKKLDDSITILESQKTSLENKIRYLNEEKKRTDIKTLEIIQKAEKFEKEKGNIKKKFDEEMKIQREEADKRDGLVSEKEQWILKKEQELRKAKAELEKFYNRKISHIII